MTSSVAFLDAHNISLTLPQEVNATPVLFTEGIFDDITIHDFLINDLLPANPTVLIIPASLGTIHTDYWGFRIGMHIRLTKALGNLRYIPFLFVSDDSLDEILVPQKEKLAIICSTSGSILVRNDEGEIRTALERVKPLDSTLYANSFLKAITINRPESTGKHSLANVWGVSRLAATTGLQDVVEANEDLKNRFKDLYFKYLQVLVESQSKQEGEVKLDELVAIKAEDKKVLLIDDEADNGWGDVLKPLFKNNLTCVSTKGKSFAEFYEEAEDKVKAPIWDLVLLDLRLDPKEDVEGNEYKMARQYSGARLLAHIKKQNGGSQVIMFTASNKAWNMQELLEMGADGYYVKESPESQQTPLFSRLTFNSLANRANICLDKDYLRDAFSCVATIRQLIAITDRKHLNIPSAVLASLNQGFSALDKATQTNQEFYLYSFLDFYRIIEVLGKQLIRPDNTGFVITGKKIANFRSIPFITLSAIIQSEITPKKNGKDIYSFEVGAYAPPESDKRFYQYPTSATRFSGLMLLRFRMTESDTIDFLRLNKLRNDLTHEGNTTAKVAPSDILEILRLIERAFKEI